MSVMHATILLLLVYLIGCEMGTILTFTFVTGEASLETKSRMTSVLSGQSLSLVSSPNIIPATVNGSIPSTEGLVLGGGHSNQAGLNNGSRADCINFNSTEATITLSCDSALADIALAVNNSNAIKKEQNEDGAWLLNSSLSIKKGATLVINEADGAKVLRISSRGNETILSNSTDDYGQHGIRVFGGLNMSGIKITSWDPINDRQVVQNPNGTIPRPYIVVEPGADPSYITDSEIEYLGYDSPRKQGLNMYGGEGTVLNGSKIHDLWVGFTSANVGHIIIENNSIYDNFEDGVDPHSGSHDLVVKDNHIMNNTNGLICSEDCYGLVFEGNQMENNAEAGVAFSKNVSDSVVRYNNISNSYIGISSSGSHTNNFSENTISSNRHGLRLDDGSSDNFIDNNMITNSSECGITLSQVENNTSVNNSIFGSKDKGICLSMAAHNNKFYSNLIDSPERFGISIKDQDAELNIFENNTLRLAENGIALSNNSQTIFVNNILYEIRGLHYRLSDNSSLNLLKSAPAEQRIRSIGATDNSLIIEDSGMISLIITDDQEEISDPYVTKTPVQNTDVSPLSKKLSPRTITEISPTP
jgi:mannuronan 5-epimerase